MSTRRHQSPPAWWRVLLDFLAFTLPWVVIFKQAGIGFTPPAEVNEPILWLMGAMLGVPGVSQILAFKYGGGTGTAGSPPEAPSPPSPPSAPSSITSGADA